MMTGMLAATLGAMTPVLAQTTEPSPYSSYLFAFFSNNSPYGEQVRYALSDDGYNYTSLNQGRPVVASGHHRPEEKHTGPVHHKRTGRENILYGHDGHALGRGLAKQ